METATVKPNTVQVTQEWAETGGVVNPWWIKRNHPYASSDAGYELPGWSDHHHY